MAKPPKPTLIKRAESKPPKTALTKRAVAKAPKTTARRAALVRVDPGLSDPQSLLGQAERVVERALRAGAGQAECFLDSSAGVDVELEKGRISGASSSRSFGGSLRLVVDGRLGFAYFTELTGVGAAIEQAMRASRLAPDDGYLLPAGGPAKALAGRWDDRVAALQVEDAVRLAGDLLLGAAEKAPKAVVSGGGVGLDAGASAIASSEAVSCADRATGMACHAALVLEDGERSVSAYEGKPSHRLDVDAHAVGAEVGERTMSLVAPTKLPKGGRMDVILRPPAVLELVAELAVSGATGDDAMRGRSLWSGMLGQSVADKRFSLVDDSRIDGAVGGSPFDGEGLATKRLPLLERGVLRSYLFDSWDAHRNKAQGTASAVRGSFKSRPETGTHHLVLSASGSKPLAKLVAGVDDGLLVDQLLGAHTANSQTGEFSVTSPGVWRIEKGEVTGPLQEVAIGGSLPGLLGSFGGASTEFRQGDGSRAPHLLFTGVNVSV